ncbi:hypothetical protein GJV26_03185 [Massilia dura]|uniref:Uncharacterized protein n=1 Tax=Pseudoduganella dura TaxID=321982 RepID=A0A6I3XFL2_9BURK|nr:hypothetical protein [Pseudoduganella dura]MUI11498.1 hypothetical protein [Pseudoduganella dura]
MVDEENKTLQLFQEPMQNEHKTACQPMLLHCFLIFTVSQENFFFGWRFTTEAPQAAAWASTVASYDHMTLAQAKSDRADEAGRPLVTMTRNFFENATLWSRRNGWLRVANPAAHCKTAHFAALSNL